MTTVYTEAPRKTPYESITSLPLAPTWPLARGVASLGEPAEKRRDSGSSVQSILIPTAAVQLSQSVYDNPDTA
ncbi:hypothetical protein N7492_010706 [Penicillium capsulatum]|uniref:Uncharacterized protein n=1 Tax=Penicillium capsulatum TaxID=69766 RepID=A0A9W9HMV7_9EURO|nr:hypothetical protein N7492_010706 [Penicillium capsulatum]